MATYYVDSNATGLNSGTSWTDAWTNLSSSIIASSGDTVLVASDHNEVTDSATYRYATGSIQAPVCITSVNKATGAYTKGAAVRQSNAAGDIILDGNAKFSGLELTAPRNFTFAQNETTKCFDCDFIRTSNANASFGFGSNNSESAVYFESCLFDSSVTPSTRLFGFSRDFQSINFRNCSFVTNNETTFHIFGNFTSGTINFFDCDLSQVPAISGDYRAAYTLNATRCSIPSAWSLMATALSPFQINLFDCDSGTITAGSYGVRQRSTYGSVDRVNTHYRSSGANDGTTDYSLKLTTDSTARENAAWVRSIPIVKTVESGSNTITVYVASNATLNDDDFWIEVSSPSEESSATARGKFRSTQALPNATPSALSTDSSSWTGSGVGTVQKVDVAINPTISGTVAVAFCLAKPSTTVYVDPKISTDGNQRVFNGVLVDGDAAASGGGGSVSAIHPLRGTQ